MTCKVHFDGNSIQSYSYQMVPLNYSATILILSLTLSYVNYYPKTLVCFENGGWGRKKFLSLTWLVVITSMPKNKCKMVQLIHLTADPIKEASHPLSLSLSFVVDRSCNRIVTALHLYPSGWTPQEWLQGNVSYVLRWSTELSNADRERKQYKL